MTIRGGHYKLNHDMPGVGPIGTTSCQSPSELCLTRVKDSSSPASVEAPIIPPAAPLITQAPSGVTTRKKPTQPVPIPPFKPRSKVERAPVPGKSGWIREQVQRQSGTTAGQWDVYFYPPGQQVKLHSRPEVRSYCENELNEPYVAADYDWKPSQKPVDTVVQEPSTEQAVNEPQGATDESDNNGTSEDSYETFAVRDQVKDAEQDRVFGGILRAIFCADFSECGNRVNFWPQPGHRLPPDELELPIENPKWENCIFRHFGVLPLVHSTARTILGLCHHKTSREVTLSSVVICLGTASPDTVSPNLVTTKKVNSQTD
uniref:MBD domain-containing protein n=1 Tax=Strigamia maritima TaxID=126957 RepID=T1IHM2_STRMM